MMNPLYELSLRLVRTSIHDLIKGADEQTEIRFCDECVKMAKENEDIIEVRKLAKVAFKWWNP